MDEILKQKLDEITKKAKADGIETKITLRNCSSLHNIIRTKEQADKFMKKLRALSSDRWNLVFFFIWGETIKKTQGELNKQPQ